jgi:hypothetical protein
MDRVISTHEVGLGTDLEADTSGRRLGVVNGLCSRLDVLADFVVVGSGEGAQVAKTVQGDGVLRSRETDGTGVSGDST